MLFSQFLYENPSSCEIIIGSAFKLLNVEVVDLLSQVALKGLSWITIRFLEINVEPLLLIERCVWANEID